MPLVGINSIHRHCTRNMFVGSCLMAFGDICAQSINLYLTNDFKLNKKLDCDKTKLHDGFVSKINLFGFNLEFLQQMDWYKVC